MVINFTLTIINTSLEPKSLIHLSLIPINVPDNCNYEPKVFSLDWKVSPNNFKIEPRANLEVVVHCKVFGLTVDEKDDIFFMLSYVNEKGKLIKERIGYG